MVSTYQLFEVEITSENYAPEFLSSFISQTVRVGESLIYFLPDFEDLNEEDTVVAEVDGL